MSVTITPISDAGLTAAIQDFWMTRYPARGEDDSDEALDAAMDRAHARFEDRTELRAIDANWAPECCGEDEFHAAAHRRDRTAALHVRVHRIPGWGSSRWDLTAAPDGLFWARGGFVDGCGYVAVDTSPAGVLDILDRYEWCPNQPERSN